MEELEQLSMFKPLNNIDCTYKSHNLIMSSYELSLTEQRIITLACKKIKPIYIEKRITPKSLKKISGALEFSEIEISVSEFRKEFNLKGNNIYDALEKYANTLYEREIKYCTNDNKIVKKRWVSTSIFDRSNGRVSLTFNPDMILDLLVFNGKYVPLSSSLLSCAKGKYVYRLYEILKTNLYIHKLKLSIEEFRFMLNITNKYKKMAEITRNVLEPCIKSINNKSDIMVSYNTIRSGKFIKWIEFTINAKSKQIEIGVENNEFKDKIPSAFNVLSKSLEKYNIELTSELAEELFDLAIETIQKNNIDIDATSFILEKIKVLDNYLISNNIDNCLGFLKKAIQKNWNVIEVKQKEKESSFNNFEPRQYDYDKLEKKLLGWE